MNDFIDEMAPVDYTLQMGAGALMSEFGKYGKRADEKVDQVMATKLDKKILLVYNPHSGHNSFRNKLHDCISVFQGAGYETHIYCMLENGGVDLHIAGIPAGFYDAIAVSGGDGTLSIVINSLLLHGHNTPVLVIPSGTANDFATSLNIPRDAEGACMLIHNAPVHCDVGLVNGRYFLNVCAVGFLADISQVVDKGLKNSLGNIAYYLTLLGKLSALTPLRVKITTSSNVFEEDIYLFLALNSSSIGGFSNLSPNASVSDGRFDFIVVKAVQLADFAMIMIKLLSGEHLSDPNIIYFQDNYVKVEKLTESGGGGSGEGAGVGVGGVGVGVGGGVTDMDGEIGPGLPIVIENRSNALRIFTPGTLGISNDKN